MIDTPDYTTLSGAEFQRAVGADPEKWAAALIQNWPMPCGMLAGWFRDAMAAAVKAVKE